MGWCVCAGGGGGLLPFFLARLHTQVCSLFLTCAPRRLPPPPLQVVRLDDMSLARVLPSAEDEINAACFHPHPGGGLAYGTKEGRLRIVRHDRSALGQEGGRAAKRAARGGGSGGGGGSSSGSDVEEGRPTERELEGLQQWMLTQQLLQSEAAAAGGGGPIPATPMAQQLEALQALWQGGRSASDPPPRA